MLAKQRHCGVVWIWSMCRHTFVLEGEGGGLSIMKLATYLIEVQTYEMLPYFEFTSSWFLVDLQLMSSQSCLCGTSKQASDRSRTFLALLSKHKVSISLANKQKQKTIKTISYLHKLCPVAKRAILCGLKVHPKGEEAIMCKHTEENSKGNLWTKTFLIHLHTNLKKKLSMKHSAYILWSGVDNALEELAHMAVTVKDEEDCVEVAMVLTQLLLLVHPLWTWTEDDRHIGKK